MNFSSYHFGSISNSRTIFGGVCLPSLGWGRLRRPLRQASTVLLWGLGSPHWGWCSAPSGGLQPATATWASYPPPRGYHRPWKVFARPFPSCIGGNALHIWGSFAAHGMAAAAANVWAAVPPIDGGRLRRSTETRALTQVDLHRNFGEDRFGR